MNHAQELIDWFAGPSPISDMDRVSIETIIRALRLLAAAESNDGTTPETDASLIPGEHDERGTIECVEADFARRIERERNGLAARVRELEKLQTVVSGADAQRLLAKQVVGWLRREREQAMTPEQLREDGHFGTREEMIARYKELKATHVAALEELARVKAPVEGEIAEVASRLRAANPKSALSVCDRAAALIESLAARNAELFEQVAALTEERDWYSTANERAGRAPAS